MDSKSQFCFHSPAQPARMLHIMLRVGNLQSSLTFYTQILGMRILRTLDQPTDKYTLAFLGYGEESNTCVLELTYNYGVSKYQSGTGYGHIAIGVIDCYQVCQAIRAQGGKIIREPAPLKGTNEVIAFIEDPDGYPVELIQLTTA